MPAFFGDALHHTRFVAHMAPATGKGWLEKANSICLVLGPSGAGKSQAFDYLMEEKMAEMKLDEGSTEHICSDFTTEALLALCGDTGGRAFLYMDEAEVRIPERQFPTYRSPTTPVSARPCSGSRPVSAVSTRRAATATRQRSWR